MDAQVTGEFLRLFGDLEDPRQANRRYLLCDIILLAVASDGLARRRGGR